MPLGDELPDPYSYHVALRGHANPPSDATLKSRDTVGMVLGIIMTLGPLTVFAIFRGAGYSL